MLSGSRVHFLPTDAAQNECILVRWHRIDGGVRCPRENELIMCREISCTFGMTQVGSYEVALQDNKYQTMERDIRRLRCRIEEMGHQSLDASNDELVQTRHKLKVMMDKRAQGGHVLTIGFHLFDILTEEGREMYKPSSNR